MSDSSVSEADGESISDSFSESKSESDPGESEYQSESDSLTEFDSTSESESEASSISQIQSEYEYEYEYQYEIESDHDSTSHSYSNLDSVSGSEFDSDNFEKRKKRVDKPQRIIGINQPTFDEQSSSSVMYYVKFYDKSYRNCKWITKRELNRYDQMVYNLFKAKNQPFKEVPFYNELLSPLFKNQYKLYKPDNVKFEEGYVIPERIISRRIREHRYQYLVKWLALEYYESTWEKDVPKELIENFIQINENPHSLRFKPGSNQPHQLIMFNESPDYKGGNKLTDYQVDALNWLQMCWLQKTNSILADEMGLGKTIEAISILDGLSKWYKNWGPFLIICPLSTFSNWRREFKKWTNFRVVSIFGEKKNRKVIKDNMFYCFDLKSNKVNKKKIVFDVLLLSYELLSVEIRFVRMFNFMYTIIDEAQRLKNTNSDFYHTCEKINSHHFLLMTGTPIQNNLYEIWSLLHFIDPKKFQNFEQFEQTYRDRENPETIEKLQEVLRPYIFRRKKIDVNLNIPEKEEIIIEVEMTQIQKTFSQLLFKDNLDILSDNSSSRLNLNNVMMQLRKLFCHPFLFHHLEVLSFSEYKQKHNIPYSTPLTEEEEIDSLILASGKTILIDKLLPKLKEGHHKVLIFSQFKMMLDILEDYLSFKKYQYERLDGECDSYSRALSIDRFQEDENSFIFLLSTKAGGLGINLTKADTVIIYDSDWNPQNDIQAQARCHRMGQKNKVNVYRLITRGSYESDLFERASKKLALDFAVLDSAKIASKNDDNIESPLKNKKELELILKKGAYYIFKDDSNEIDKFCSENIEQILEHRSYTLKDLVSGGNSKFSKASFNAQINDSAFSQNDFWNKLIGTQSIIENHDKTNKNLILGIRRRKKIDYTFRSQGKKEVEKSSDESSDDLFNSPKEDENQEEEDLSNVSDFDLDLEEPQKRERHKKAESIDNPTKEEKLDQQTEEKKNDGAKKKRKRKRKRRHVKRIDAQTLLNDLADQSNQQEMQNNESQNQQQSPQTSSTQNNQGTQSPSHQLPSQSTRTKNNIVIQSLIHQPSSPSIRDKNNLGIKSLIHQPSSPSIRTQSSMHQLYALFNGYRNYQNIKYPVKEQQRTLQQKEQIIQSVIKNGMNVMNITKQKESSPLNQSKKELPTQFISSSKKNTAENNLSQRAQSMSILDFALFKTSIDPAIYKNALSVLTMHGIGALRFFVSDFVNEVAKSLISIVFLRLPQTQQQIFCLYIQQHIPNIKKQIMYTPYKELINNLFLNSLFNGNEYKIMVNCHNYDLLYRVAIYISNNKLPQNFQFAPEMVQFGGWSAIEDFAAITMSPFLNKLSDICEDDKFPFKKLVKKFPPLKEWIYQRIELMIREISKIIPDDFSIYEASDCSKPKELCNIDAFKRLNCHVIHPKQLNRCLQKKILRILYLYGLPLKNGIDKIIFILQNEVIDTELITIFIYKVLLKAIKYKPGLRELLDSIPKINNANDYTVNIDWIKEEAIEAVASNLDLILEVRKGCEWAIKNNSIQEIMNLLPEWKEITVHYKWWNSKSDHILFKMTAYYGFLLNSMMCHFFTSSLITDDDILEWREREILTLTPIIHPKSKYLDLIFTFELRKKRVVQIVDAIYLFKNMEIYIE